jgi:hypothetical protein
MKGTTIAEIAKHFNEIQPRKEFAPLTYTLIQAIGKIEANLITGSKVTAIQFEDGSGYKFNVQIDGGKWEFINIHDLTAPNRK